VKCRPLLLAALLVGPATAGAFHKDFTLVNDRAPLEFKLMFESMKYALKEHNEQLRLIVIAQHINKGLGPLKKDQAFFLLKSEIYKTILEWPNPSENFQVGSHTLERMKANLAASQAIYTPFSKWILEALIADLEEFKKEGLLDLSAADRASLTGERGQRYLKLQRVLRYTRPWLAQADTISAKDFNALTQQVAWSSLERVKERAALFRRFSSQAIQETSENTFNIPEQGMPQEAGPRSRPPVDGDASMSEKAAQEKSAAEETVGNLDVGDSDVPRGQLSEAIDQLDVESEVTAPAPVPPAPAPSELK